MKHQLDIRALLESLTGKHVVVVGDLMLDEFARGDVKRISPEAPVPVLEVTTRVHALGGAANAAANVVSLGARATIIGLLGDDTSASLVETLLAAHDLGGLVVRDAARPTTHKTRLVARGQQIVRIDQESRDPPEGQARALLLANVSAAMENADACILSDYAKGAIFPELADLVTTSAKKRGIPVVADPKHRDFRLYRGVTVVTPNTGELELAAGFSCAKDEDVARAAKELLPLLAGGALLATRGADGMTLYEPGQTPFHVRALAKSVFDVTGAGDTVVATLATCLAGGAKLPDAVMAASAAASVVVSKVGTATVSPAELAQALHEELAG